MKITYTGRHIELSPAQTQQLQAEFDTVSRILDTAQGEAHAHVLLSRDHHLNHAEVTIPYHHHELKADASDTDLFTALHAAVRKFQAQAVRVKDKWREGRKAPKPEPGEESEGN